MVAKDPKRRKEIARMGAIAQHKKHGCLIPLEARQRGGRNSSKSQNRKKGHYTEKLFEQWAEDNGYIFSMHGFPDAIMKMGDEIKLVEIKPRQKIKLEKSQKKTFALLKELGIEVMIWTPTVDRNPYIE